MVGMKDMLTSEKMYLEEVIKKAKLQLKKAGIQGDILENKLRISVDKERIRYYKCTPDNKKGSYILKKDLEVAKKLAQNEYNYKLLKRAQKRLKQIEDILEDYEDDEIDNCLYKEHIAKQRLITPLEPTWESKLNEWEKTEYKGKELNDDTIEIYTQKGERVRSKSEKILADYFYYNNISYKYECPLKLNGYGIIYPDFTFLSPRLDKEIYWEHDGMMDDPVYAKNAIKKIEAYERNGIFPGERLILTFETSQYALNNNIIEAMVEKYLL